MIPGFSGITIRSSEMLKGCKVAVKQDGVLIVSPAMLHLIRTSNQAELQKLCDGLKVLDLDPRPHDIEWIEDTIQIMQARFPCLKPGQRNPGMIGGSA